MWLILLSIICLFYWIWWKYTEATDPPSYPGQLPVIGHVHHIVGDTTHIWTTLQKIVNYCLSNQNVITYWIGPRRVYIVTDPDECLTIANACLEKDTLLYKLSEPLFGDGLFTASVPIWKPHRKLLNPAFSQQVLDGYIEVFNDQARRLVSKLSVELNNGPFDTLHYFRENSLQTICLTAMGLDIGEDSKFNHEYVRAIDQILKCFIERYQKFWLMSDVIFKHSNLKKTQDKCLKIIYDMTDKILQMKKSERDNAFKGTSNHSSSNGLCVGTRTKIRPLIDILLDLEDQFTDKEIRDEVNTMIMAGYENIATVLMFTLVLVGSYPEVQDRVYAELQQLFKKDADIGKQDLSRLVYLEAVLKESMRYYTTVPAVPRYIDRDVKLKNYTLRAGHNCTLIVHGVNRHPIWGEDVEEFRPERWLDTASLPMNANTYVAFGFGRRNCIGRVFAMMSMKITLALILWNYRVYGDHRHMTLKLDSVLKPASGHHISIERRRDKV